MPASVVVDVYHRERPRVAVLHRAVQHEGLWEFYAGECHAEQPARDMERTGVSTLSRRVVDECSAACLRQLRPSMEPLGFMDAGVAMSLTIAICGEQRDGYPAARRLLCRRINGSY
jgi:hypothetical protein